MMKRKLTILLFVACVLMGRAQSLVINQSLELVAMSSALTQYNNKFGQFNMPDKDDSFPYAVVCMNLTGDVRAAKEILRLDLGTMHKVESTHKDIDNTILFLVPVSARSIYLTCGDGCSRQLLWDGKMQSNKVYKCAVEYRKAQEAKQGSASTASDEKMEALLAQMAAMQQEMARLQQNQVQVQGSVQPKQQPQVSSAVQLYPQPEYSSTITNSGNKLFVNVNGISFMMIEVESGSFTMGATGEQSEETKIDEMQTHSVTLSTYYMGETEVTQGLWDAVMGDNPAENYVGENYPVENVSWEECQIFISKLNNLLSSQLGSKHFMLPTEAQWEYAARGGKRCEGYKYSGSNSLSAVAWYWKNSGRVTHPVKMMQPNELGLYDMSGNVWEWCQDWFGDYYSSSQTNPQGPTSGSCRVYRGGGCYADEKSNRVSYRGSDAPSKHYNDLGLRLCLQ